MISGEVMLGLAGVDLIYLRLQAMLCAADRGVETGGAMSRVYLYALLSAAPSCEAGLGVCAEPLRVVAVDGLVALVGDVAEPPAPTAVILRAQDAVLRRLALAVEARAARALRHAASTTTRPSPSRWRPPSRSSARALGRVAGCEQMTLRVWGESAPAAPAADARRRPRHALPGGASRGAGVGPPRARAGPAPRPARGAGARGAGGASRPAAAAGHRAAPHPARRRAPGTSRRSTPPARRCARGASA